MEENKEVREQIRNNILKLGKQLPSRPNAGKAVRPDEVRKGVDGATDEMVIEVFQEMRDSKSIEGHITDGILNIASLNDPFSKAH